MHVKEILKNPYSPWMDDKAPETDVVISSRARLARSLNQFPFPYQLTTGQAGQILDRVSTAIENPEVIKRFGNLELIKMADFTSLERLKLVEKHLVSPAFVLEGQTKLDGKGLVLSPNEQLSIMVNEEDHLRIQFLCPGLTLMEAFQAADATDSLLEKNLDYGFSDRYGYLTACPTNVGTGLRVSVMMHLPALVLAGKLKEVLNAVAKLGLAVRGLFGEGTEAAGHLFQLSNQVTLGHSETEITENLTVVTRQVIEQERAAREQLKTQMPILLQDRVSRALGVLSHAFTLSTEEAMRLLSDLRLGVSLGLIEGPTLKLISELMVRTRPPYLIQEEQGNLMAAEVEVTRAKVMREALWAAKAAD